jgi:hypothetical protein
MEMDISLIKETMETVRQQPVPHQTCFNHKLVFPINPVLTTSELKGHHKFTMQPAPTVKNSG